MGWEQVVFPLTSFSECQGTIVNFDCCENRYSKYSSNTQQLIDFIDQYVSGSFLDTANIAKDSRTTIYEKDGYILQIAPYDIRTGYVGPGIELYFEFPDGSEHVRLRNDGRYSQTNKVYAKIALAINEDTSQGVCVIGSYTESYSTSLNPSEPSPSQTTYTRLYEWITNAKPGPPKPQGDATCKVNYYLQEDDYEYSKLTFKEDTPPIDMNDGYVQDILASQSSVNIENLVEGQKYYFTIFTNKSESEPFSYIVGEAPIPEVNGIIIYKNGRIYRDDSIVSSDPYCSADGYTPGRARLDSWNIEYKSDSIEISTINSSYTDGTPYFSVDFNLSTKTGTRITKPLIATVSQLYNSRTVLTNVLKIKFEINLTMQSSNYNKFSPRFYYGGLHNGSSVIRSSYIAQYLTDKSHVSGNYIIADSSESFGISETLEIPVYYYDYNTGSSYSFTSEAPHLWFDLGESPTYSGPSNFNLKINIKQILCEMNQVSLPKKDDEFYICVHGYGENGPVLWTIEELYSEVKKLGHNSFVLYPSYKTYSNTMYSIWPFTMNVTDDLYVCKDKYITNQNYYFAIGVSSSGVYSQDWFYDSNNDMTKTLKQSSGKWGLTQTKTVNNVQYAYNYISQYNNRQTFVFYTEGYKRLYVNNVLLDEK